MGVIWVTFIVLFAVCQAIPLPSKLKYDQKQEGKWNIRADLENFIILVIPTSPSSTSGATNGSLLDFLSRSIPLPYYKKPKKHLKVHHHEDGNLPDTEQFIESKTAPYHVDISRTRSHLAKLHPEVNIPENVKEEIIIARSPSVALSKSQDIPEGRDRQQLKTSRAILITVPMENENIQRHGIKDVIGGKASEDIKKSVGLSIEAIEKGLQLADQMQNPMKESKDKIEAEEMVKEKPENSHGSYLSTKLEEIAEEVRKNETVNKAVVMAKVVQAGLVEYFRKIAEKLKEKEEAEKETPYDESVAKLPSALRQKVRKVIVAIKEKGEDKEKSVDSKMQQALNEKYEKIAEKLKDKEGKFKNPIPNMPKVELEPPKMPEDQMENNVNKDMEKPLKQPNEASKEDSKGELLLLGAVNEQCGPKRERDSSGMCIWSAEKLKDKEVKFKNPISNMPKIELEPPKTPEDQMENNVNKDMEKPSKEPNEASKEDSKEELLLLGAVHEQCGPGQERDSSGICTSIVKS